MEFPYLPPDVLENIFHLIVDAERLDATPPHPRSFIRVSSLWRTTALLSPSLWRHIPPIVIPEHNRFSADYNRRQLIDTYLQRSKGLTITFSLVARHFEVDFTYTESLASVVNRLKVHSHRWENVTLDLHPNVLSLFADVRGRLPALKTLRVVSTRRMIDQNWSVDYFSEAPALRNVTLICGEPNHGQAPPPRHWSFSLPWHQLAAYKEEAVYNIGFVQVIAGSTNLTSAHLETGYFSPTTSQIYIRHEKLTQLNLDIGKLCVFGGLLPTLFDHGPVFPSLEDLRVSLKHGVFSLDGISSLVTRSQCPLRRLSLTRCAISPGTLIPLLQHCPELEELCVDNLPGLDLRRLAWKPGSTEVVLVPKLRNLVIHFSTRFGGSGSGYIDHQTLNEFAHSRVDVEREGVQSSLTEPQIAGKPSVPGIIIYLSAPQGTCLYLLQQLEGLPPIGPVGVAQTMVHTWKHVMDQLMQRPTQWLTEASINRRFIGLGRKYNTLRSILTEMDSFNPVDGTNLTLIYKNDIPGTLERLVALLPERESTSGLSTILGGMVESTPAKARRLLAKWKPLLVNHAINHRRWTLKEGTTAIVYLGVNSDERRDVGKAWEVVTGTAKLNYVPLWWESDMQEV